MPSLTNTALIFLELFSIECCAVLVEPSMTSSLIIQKRKDLQNEKRYAKKENAILLYSEKTLNEQQSFFYFIGTLNNCDIFISLVQDGTSLEFKGFSYQVSSFLLRKGSVLSKNVPSKIQVE